MTSGLPAEQAYVASIKLPGVFLGKLYAFMLGPQPDVSS
jgi:hypothetical protein